MSQPKSQHFVPAFFLSNFTKNKTRQSKFEVYDFINKKYRSSKPDKECKQNHLYTLSEPPDGMPPYFIEKEILGKLESDVKPIITEIVQTKVLPNNTETYQLFFYFLGVLAARHPSVNDSISRAIAHTGNILIDIIGENLGQSTLDGYYEKSNTPLEERLPLDEVKELLSTEKFYAVANNDVVIPSALKTAETITTLLLERKWMLVVADKGDKFITCDRPLALHATSKGPKTGPLGFGMLHTEVIICLSSQIALVGTFEEIPSPVYLADIEMAASINRVNIDSARRNLFFEDKHFNWIDNDYIIRSGSDLEKTAKFKKSFVSKNKK